MCSLQVLCLSSRCEEMAKSYTENFKIWCNVIWREKHVMTSIFSVMMLVVKIPRIRMLFICLLATCSAICFSWAKNYIPLPSQTLIYPSIWSNDSHSINDEQINDRNFSLMRIIRALNYSLNLNSVNQWKIYEYRRIQLNC